MIQILQLQGTENRLYQLVAPLVMNPAVLKQNYNFPFRTSEKFVWFIAVSGKKVIGFIPVERKRSESVINNYYIEKKDCEILKQLLQAVIQHTEETEMLAAIAFRQDVPLFKELGFTEEKQWTRYVKMRKG